MTLIFATWGGGRKSELKAGAKEENKCEAEEIQHKAKKNFEKEGCKTEIKGTKARQSAGRIKKIQLRIEIDWVFCYIKFSIS